METVPYGYCHCGCGRPTTVAHETDRSHGRIKGEPVRYIVGHSSRGRHSDRPQYSVEDRGHDTPCWIWQLRTQRDGYGLITICRSGTRRTWRAHRWYYTTHVGPIPDGLQLDHLCRVRSCVNPAHLEPVTAQVNIARGIAALRRRRLSPADVREIKALLKTGRSLRSIGRQFGVTHGAIQGIARGSSWRHVT